MPKLSEMAPKDETKHLSLEFRSASGAKFPISLDYYPNRITLEGNAPEDEVMEDEDGDPLSDDDATALRAARSLCYRVASWDVEGELKNRRGEVAVPDGQIVPLDDPQVVRLVPTRVLRAVNDAIDEDAFPSSRRDRRATRSSRR